MKVRAGFVSNSSSSSFVVRKEFLTPQQLFYIKEHHKMSSELYDKGTLSDYCGDDERWGISEDEFVLTGSTSMDNFDMYAFMKHIGVDMDKVEWGD
jgi:hypothetical protein